MLTPLGLHAAVELDGLTTRPNARVHDGSNATEWHLGRRVGQAAL